MRARQLLSWRYDLVCVELCGAGINGALASSIVITTSMERIYKKFPS